MRATWSLLFGERFQACETTGGTYRAAGVHGVDGTCAYTYGVASGGSFVVVSPPGSYMRTRGMVECGLQTNGYPYYRYEYEWSNGATTSDCGTEYP